MHRPRPRSPLRSSRPRTAAVTALAVVSISTVALAPPAAAAAVIGDPTAMAQDVAARSAHLGSVSPAPAVRVDGHVGGLPTAVGLAAAGFVFGDAVDATDIVSAAAEYGVEISDPLRAVDVGHVRDAAWTRAASRFAVRGIEVTGRPDIADLARAAEALGIDPASATDPASVDRILVAAHDDIAARLRAGGFPVGERVDETALRGAAYLYEVAVGDELDAGDTLAIADAVAREGDADRSARYATIGEVDLHLPGFGPYYVGFHQSSSGAALVQEAVEGVRTDVLPSRDRGTAATGAVDVVLRPGDDVVAAVTGEVVEVNSYSLYGQHPDLRISIVPDDDPDLLVTMLHVDGAAVEVGDRVVGGQSVVADTVRTFPFASQIDRFSGQDWGHVHVEAHRR